MMRDRGLTHIMSYFSVTAHATASMKYCIIYHKAFVLSVDWKSLFFVISSMSLQLFIAMHKVRKVNFSKCIYAFIWKNMAWTFLIVALQAFAVLEWLEDFKKSRFADFFWERTRRFFKYTLAPNLSILLRTWNVYYFTLIGTNWQSCVHLVNISELYRQRQGLPPKLQVSGHVHLFSLKEVCIFHELIM
jgi:hypothetical protein